jgi:GR25 family glycosyltransferase involved in LPS biosynthesis
MEYSVFSCGTTNTALALAELMKGLGHEATLINHNTGQSWWDDCQQVKRMFTSIALSDISKTLEVKPFDLILEVGQYTLSAEQRKTLTTDSIWILRKPFVLGEIEMSIFPTKSSPRNLEGIKETWLLNDVTSPDDLTAVELLTRAPVVCLPFIWTPILAEIHHRSIEGNGPWKADPSSKMIVHMVDTNTTSSSNSTIPLVILRESAKQKVPIDSWKLHNGEMIVKSKFFRENVLKHCTSHDLSGACVGRQRCVEWTMQPNNIAIAHLRFRGLRPVLLDLSWAGIPVVHNSLVLSTVGGGLEQFYYSDNSILEGAAAMGRVAKMIQSDGLDWCDRLKDRREQILRNWSPVSPYIRQVWGHHINRIQPVKSIGINPTAKPQSVASEFTVVFCDMWENFKEDYNFFTLLLNEAGKHMIPCKSVKGYSPSTLGDKTPDLVIFGPFGNLWQAYPGIPKVHFTGENTERVEHPDVKLNLGFKHYDMVTKNYLRFPLWFTEINWFQADVERLVNPKPIPLELCTRTNETSFKERSKFCSFIVSNPRNSLRNQAFHWLNNYKPVCSGGALYNNIGPELFAGQGGGGGELKKMQFMMDYKFALAYENNSARGYTTEKYLHAKAAGTVPIYWGDPDFQRDFDPAGCLDARNVKTPDELINLVKSCESEEIWCKHAAVPALDSYKVELVRKTLAELAKRAYTIMGAETGSIPDSIGAKANSVEASFGMDAFLKKVETISQPEPQALQVPLLVTYVTYKFLGTLQQWLMSSQTQLRAFPDMKALVFVGPDVSKETVAALKEKYTHADFEYVPSDWTPPDFADFWEPTHYAWKIWIFNTLVNRAELKDKLILYMDAGSMLVRWPTAWMELASASGIACLEDPRQENERWCGDAFCESMSVSDEEREKKQIWAGSMCFIAGHPTSIKFFAEAFKYAQQSNVIVGPRVSGVSVDGKSYGHRHDQSILSILVRRHNIALINLDTVYCDHSMRRTFQTGKAIYAHRGNFVKSVPFLPGIDDSYVINLDRRNDRMEKFWKTHPELEGRVQRQPAYDGLTIEMTPELQTLFAPNDFFWKKAVTGCAMSHLSLWWKLVNEQSEISNYLIFEDDAKLEPGWEEILEASMAHVPEDYDVLYLGGILPPNRAGFKQVLEPVTKYYSRIKPHQLFGQREPSRYYHSCAYAYILSRRGAIKIMEGLQDRKGYWTSADHILCSPCETMNLYFLTPVVAGCFQDDDPAYANSEFNNFSRIDKFDSDLWNNDERFTNVISNFSTSCEEFELRPLLSSIFNPKKPIKTPPVKHSQVTNLLPYSGPSVVDADGTGLPVRFLRFHESNIEFSIMYEGQWLLSLFGNLKAASIESISMESKIPEDCPIVILQRPYVVATTQILKKWSALGAKFKILHLSDECDFVPSARDPLDAYSLEGCKSVLRFYIRDDFPEGTESKVQIIPLGYHWSPLNLNDHPLYRTPQIPFREIHWSFYGTNWLGREAQMKPLIDSKLIGSYKFYKEWNDSENLSKNEYTAKLLNTIFIPCPDGMNSETFRLYEALEAGCIPLVIHTEKNDAWFRWISCHIPLLDINSWEDAVRNMMQLIVKPENLQIYRTELLNSWVKWYTTLKLQSRKWLLS